MKATVIDNVEAPNKWWAAHDARMKNIANASKYSEKDKIRAERMKVVLEMVYKAKGVYISYGKTGISIKVDHAVVFDRKNLRLLEKDWTAAGVTKRQSEQGVIYRF